MRRMLLSSIALAMFGVNAQGADLPRKAPAMTQPVPFLNWTGFFVGGHIGGAWRDNDDMFGGSSSGSDGRFIGGGQVGFDYQFWNTWVVGFEANYSFVDRNNGDGTTTLVGRTWYTLHVRPAPYFDWWTHDILSAVHLRVMEDIRRRAEAPVSNQTAELQH